MTLSEGSSSTDNLNIWLSQSCYSFLHTPSHPHELIAAAQSQGWSGMCLADCDGVYGLARFFLSRRLLEKETSHHTPQLPLPHLIYGAQLRLPLGGLDDITLPEWCHPSDALAPLFLQPRFALVALSHRGYTEICKLLRYTHRHGKTASMLGLDDEDVPWPEHDVAVVIPMRGWSSLCPPHTRRAATWLSDLGRFYDLWKHHQKKNCHFFLAVTPPSQPLEHQALNTHLWAHQCLGIPLLATEDVFFARSEDKKTADLLAAVRLNLPLSVVEPWACLPNAARTLCSRHRLLHFCQRDKRLMTALHNNRHLMNHVSFSFDELHYEYPREFVPQGMSAIQFLRQLTWEQAKLRYGRCIPERVQDLLYKELNLVEDLNFADYFLTVWDIVRFARQNTILCQGRGSAANSCICFVLGITAVDPMVSDVLFERFISRERGEPPDIDVDFEHERREEVIQYIYSRYGRTRAAMVANIITFRRQGALRAAGKALGIKLETIDTLLKGTRDRFMQDTPLPQLMSERAASMGLALSDVQRDEWLRLAKSLIGLPRHLGLHSGGFVMSQNSLDALCPTEPATMEGRSVIQWCKDDLEGLGLFKIDVLALGMLTALRKTLALLSEHGKTLAAPNGTCEPAPKNEEMATGAHNKKVHKGAFDDVNRTDSGQTVQSAITLASIPPNCPQTFDAICQAKTMGTFQIESRAQMSMIPRMQPRSFYDLVIQIGIIRPGPIVAGIVTRYIKRRTGEERIHYPDSRLRSILERTLGVPVFQEQVMRIAMTVGDFTPGEADELRRSMGAWKLTGDIQKFEAKLRAGMKRNAIDPVFADEIYKQIEGFSEYGFPESHAISFAHLAYASAWLKTHYPAYFLAGLLNAQPLGFYSVHSLLQEAKHAGVRILPPCLLFSQWDHSLAPTPPQNRAPQSSREPDGVLRIGLRLVSGLRMEQAHDFLSARKQWLSRYAPNTAHLQTWTGKNLDETLDSFLHLMSSSFDSRCCMQLIVGGLLDNFSQDRRMLLWHWLGKPSPLLNDLTLHPFRSTDPNKAPWNESHDDVQDDFHVLGTSLRGHPLSFFKRWMWPFEVPVECLTTAAELVPQQKNRRNSEKSLVHVCGLITMKQAPPTAKGMIFVTIEDETGTIALTLTPQIAARYRQELTSDRSGLLCVTGHVQGPAFGNSVMVQTVYGHNDMAKSARHATTHTKTRHPGGAFDAGNRNALAQQTQNSPNHLRNGHHANTAQRENELHDPKPALSSTTHRRTALVPSREHFSLRAHPTLWQEEQ